MTNSSIAIERALLDAHAGWLGAERQGEGRLVLRGRKLTGSLAGADLRGADLEGVSCEAVDLAGASLDGARLVRCSLERADLRRASLVDARLEACDLRRAQVAGMLVERTGFLRCAFGDFGAQPIGKPEVRGPFAALAPDFSPLGDGSRIGAAPEVDARWYAPARGGDEAGRRKFVFEGPDGVRYGATVLHMHVKFAREAGPRFEDRVTYVTFRQFLEDGGASAFSPAVPPATLAALRTTVAALAPSWTPEGA